MKRILTLFFAICIAGIFSARAQVVNFTGYYHQDFDSLENNGTTGDSLPNGWYFYETGTNANTTYSIGTGSATSGDTYSFGAANSTDRAFGSLLSGSNSPMIGVAFKNSTGRTVDTIRMTFRVEQWRLGSKSNGTTSRIPDSMRAEISPFATNLGTPGVWKAFPQMNFYTADTTGAIGPVNGNSNKYSYVFDETFTGLAIPNGQTLWIRWVDYNVSSSDDGLAIDSFTMEIPAPPVPEVAFNTTSATVEEGDSVQITLNISNANTSATAVNVDVLSSSTASTSDYTFTSGSTFTFPANSSSPVSFWLKTTDDNTIEKQETLRLTLSGATNNAMFGDSVFVLTITDNDTTQTYKIREAKFPQTNGVPDTTKYGYIHGVVISPDFDGGNGIQFAVKDSTGAIAVVNPFLSLGYAPKIGDSVLVRGKVSSYLYSTFLLPDSIHLKNSGNSIPAATVTTTLNDNNESDLVTVKDLKLINPSQWKAVIGSGGFYVTATNGSKTFDIFIDENTTLFGNPAPAFQFDITGIVLQAGINGPTTGYAIFPRSAGDLKELVYPSSKIIDVKGVDSNSVPTALNKKVWLTGIVQSPTYRPNSFEFSLQDSTAGIIVFRTPGNFGYTPNVGDSVMVLGTVVNFNGLTELTVAASDTLIVLSTGGFPIAAQTVTEFTEEMEGSLLRLEDVTIINPAQWTKTGAGFNVDITNGTDTFQMRIDADIDLYKGNAPTGRFNVTGVLTQFDNSSPYTTGYQLLPRSSKDIELIVDQEPVYTEHTISQVRRTDPTSGIADSLGVKAWIRGIVHSETFNPSTLEFSLIDNSGGIIVTSNTTNLGYAAVRGDSIRVLGTVMQTNGLTTFAADSIIKLNSANILIPAAVGAGAILEGNEGSLVKLEGVQLVNTSEWTTGQGTNGFDVHVYNGTDTFVVRIDKDVELYNMAAPSGTLNITGVLYQDDPTSPYLSNYMLMPRDSMDITAGVGIAENSRNTVNVLVYPNPAATNITVKADFVADMIIVTDVMGREIVHYAPTSISENINISALKPGVYFVKVQKDGNIATQKLYKY